MEGYTNFTKVYATEVRGASIVGPVTGNADTATSAAKLTGSIISANTLSKSDNYALTASEIAKVFTSITQSGDNKTLTLGLAAGQAMIVHNAGAKTITIKNVSGDTGTSLATTKAILVVGSATQDASIVIALN